MTETTDFGSIVAFALLSILALYIGKKRDFFPLPETSWITPLRWFHVVMAFVIYFFTSSFLTPIVGQITRPLFFSHPTATTPLAYASFLNFFNSCAISLLLLFFLTKIPKMARQGIFKNTEAHHSYLHDAYFALFAWLISFPLVLFVNQLADWIVVHIFHAELIPEQIAVYFLKMTFGHPVLMGLTVSSIVIFAPLIEETLFRGFLQSFIRQHLGSKQAIGITSFLFALFHYSPEQGIANITIIASLFTFSIFLGLVYEKRQCLLAPILLHSLFNAINVCNLYFLGGIPKGAL